MIKNDKQTLIKLGVLLRDLVESSDGDHILSWTDEDIGDSLREALLLELKDCLDMEVMAEMTAGQYDTRESDEYEYRRK